jgi:hypothetical protein
LAASNLKNSVLMSFQSILNGKFYYLRLKDQILTHKPCCFQTAMCGGGKIKHKYIYAILMISGMVLFILPFGVDNTELTPQETSKINADQKTVDKNADYKSNYAYMSNSYKTVRSVMTYKSSYRSTSKYKTYRSYRYKYVYKWKKIGKKWKRVRYLVKVRYYKRTTTTKAVSAASKTTTKVTQGNPDIAADYVEADARCSCSLSTDYNIHHGKYLNYCPHCNKNGIISYTNAQGCPEGMFYCDMGKGGCDADYCIVHGKEHVNSDPKYLTPA